jgi:hypothetical protein
MGNAPEFIWRPRGGLIERYIDVYGPTTDAPIQFHVFVCLTLMGTVLGRRVWLQDGAQPLYLNLFTLLLAPSSLYRKSTTVAHGQDVIRDLEARADRSTRLLFPNQFTPESFLEILKDQPEGLLVVDEFRSFLDGMKRDYNAGLRELFMSLYDGRGVHRKIRSAEFRIEHPCVSILGACATSWFVEATKQGEIRSGFYPRLVMVPAWQKTMYQARGAAPDRKARHVLLGNFNSLRQAQGEIILPPKLEQLFGEWSIQHQREINGHEYEAELASFYTRIERVTLKLAALIQLADDPGRREIGHLAMADALNLTAWLQAGIRRLFAQEFTFTKDEQDKQRVLDRIRKKPGIERRELLRLSHLKVTTFDPILDTLIQEGSITGTRKDGYHLSQSPQGVTKSGVTH